MPAKTAGNPDPISCGDHTHTYKTAYSYFCTEKDFQQKHNAEVVFGDNVDRAHGVLHKGDDNAATDGFVSTATEHYQDVGRAHGAYDLKEPPHNHTPQKITKVILNKHFSYIFPPIDSCLAISKFWSDDDVCTLTADLLKVVVSMPLMVELPIGIFQKGVLLSHGESVRRAALPALEVV